MADSASGAIGALSALIGGYPAQQTRRNNTEPPHQPMFAFFGRQKLTPLQKEQLETREALDDLIRQNQKYPNDPYAKHLRAMADWALEQSSDKVRLIPPNMQPMLNPDAYFPPRILNKWGKQPFTKEDSITIVAFMEKYIQITSTPSSKHYPSQADRIRNNFNF